MEEDEVQEYINEQDLHKSMGPGKVFNEIKFTYFLTQKFTHKNQILLPHHQHLIYCVTENSKFTCFHSLAASLGRDTGMKDLRKLRRDKEEGER